MDVTSLKFIGGSFDSVELPLQNASPLHGTVAMTPRGNVVVYNEVTSKWDTVVTMSDSLYPFEQFTFTDANLTGRTGPTHAQLLSAYAATGQTWLQNPEFFSSTGGVQKWTVPKTGKYLIETVSPSNGSGIQMGAVVSAVVSLTEGDILRLIVGQYPGGYGGGGASAVISDVLGCILVAGGFGQSSQTINGNAELTFAAIGDSSGGLPAAYGSGSTDTNVAGGGGAGFTGDGGKPAFPAGAQSAGSLNTTAVGGMGPPGYFGGFGGGGAGASGTNSRAVGGGGGYKGADAAAAYAIVGLQVGSKGGQCYALVGNAVENATAVANSGSRGHIKIVYQPTS